MSFFHELRRRSVFKVAVAYAAVAWLLIEVSSTTFPMLRLPDWAPTLVLVLLIIGFPVALILAWAFEVTPEGIRRDSAGTRESEVAPGESSPAAERDVPAGKSIAVLPFVNMSDDASNEYFSDGLSEELLNLLAKIPELHVAARTSSFAFKDEKIDIPTAARKLNVANVLEGSVRKAGDRVRITVQLIKAADGYHLWSETYDRELDDIFVVQDEIASAVASALKVKLLGEDQDLQVVGGTTNTEAFQAYLLGLHYRNRGDHEDAVRASIDAYRKAIELDPEYAKAYVGLADAWSRMSANSFTTYEEGVTKMEAAITTALELAPKLADAYMAQAFFLTSFKMDPHGADKAISTALELNPGSAEVQLEFARIKCYQGHSDEGIAAARRAVDLDPVSLSTNHFLGHVLYFSRRYKEAIPAFRHVLDMDPHYPKPHYFISMSMFWMGDVEAAWEEIQQEPLDWMRWTASAVILQRLGRAEEAKANLAMISQDENQEFATVQRADVYAQWNDVEMAIRNLDLAFDYGDPGMAQMLVDPFLDPIRDDPRFVELMKKIGFDRASIPWPH